MKAAIVERLGRPPHCTDVAEPAPSGNQVAEVRAAALPNAAVSAWFGLEQAGQIRPGASVLVVGATGVTGSLAVQLAKHRFAAGRVVAASW